PAAPNSGRRWQPSTLRASAPTRHSVRCGSGGGKVHACLRTRPVLRILLPLLLCLSLIATAVGSVWSATAMAVPMQTMAQESGDGTHDCCHQDLSMQCDADGSGQAPASCGDGNHCDCKQHCNMLP